MLYVSESIVIEKEGKLIALIYPDFDAVNTDKLSDEKLAEFLTNNLKELNQQLPAYSQVSTYKLYNAVLNVFSINKYENQVEDSPSYFPLDFTLNLFFRTFVSRKNR